MTPPDDVSERMEEIRAEYERTPHNATDEMHREHDLAEEAVPYLLSLVEDVGRALARTDQRTVYAFLDRVEEDVGQEAVEALAQVRDAALKREYDKEVNG